MIKDIGTVTKDQTKKILLEEVCIRADYLFYVSSCLQHCIMRSFTFD